MIATTIKQSKRLLACGVKAETADMIHLSYESPEPCGNGVEILNQLVACAYADWELSDSNEVVPAWSLSALLTNVLPPIIDVGLEAEVQIGKADDEWYCEYLYTTFYVSAKDPIEACVRMVELLHGKDVLL